MPLVLKRQGTMINNHFSHSKLCVFDCKVVTLKVLRGPNFPPMGGIPPLERLRWSLRSVEIQ